MFGRLVACMRSTDSHESRARLRNARLLEAYGFDPQLFERCARSMLRGELSADRQPHPGPRRAAAARRRRAAARAGHASAPRAARARAWPRCARARSAASCWPAAWPRASAAWSRRGRGAAGPQLPRAQARRHPPDVAQRAGRARARVPDVELRDARHAAAAARATSRADEAPIEVFPQFISLRLDARRRAVPRGRRRAVAVRARPRRPQLRAAPRGALDAASCARAAGAR